MESIGLSDWLLLLGAPIACAALLWRNYVNQRPEKLVEKALLKMKRDYKDQIHYALPCESYQGGQTSLGVLAVLDARMHYESVMGDRGFDVNYARIRAYLFQDKTAAGAQVPGMRVLLVSTDGGSVDFGIPAWGEAPLGAALKGAAGKPPLASPK